MKISVISYSMTGNNDALAAEIADVIAAEHIVITEPRHRSMGKIVLDILLDRSPKIDQNIDGMEENDLVLFVGPVWMGHAASPLRPCLNHLRARPCDYAFISISGGADGPNPSLGDDLVKRAGKAPKALIDLHIADLLPSDRKPTRKDTMRYRLDRQDTIVLCNTAVRLLRDIMGLRVEGIDSKRIEGSRVQESAESPRRQV
ncbi:MAG: flavodoxin family protein [Thermoplasmatota archaeon]